YAYVLANLISRRIPLFLVFFFQAEDGIRDSSVTGVQTCALPIFNQATLKAALDGLKSAMSDVEISGVTLARHKVSGLQKDALRGLVDAEKARLKTSAVVVAANSSPEGAATLVVSITPDLKGRLSAGNIVKELAPMVGGRGGGRPDFADAGGR